VSAEAGARERRRTGGAGERGNALVEFTLLLPLLLLILLGCSEICLLLERQIRLIHLSREAASVYSRGAGVQQTLGGILAADGDLALDGAAGQVILTRVARDPAGTPVITEQSTVGALGRSSSVGTLPPSGIPVPATIPNGRTVPPNMTLVVVELFSLQPQRFVAPGIWDRGDPMVLHGLAVF
jgi:hypothetical protein